MGFTRVREKMGYKTLLQHNDSLHFYRGRLCKSLAPNFGIIILNTHVHHHNHNTMNSYSNPYYNGQPHHALNGLYGPTNGESVGHDPYDVSFWLRRRICLERIGIFLCSLGWRTWLRILQVRRYHFGYKSLQSTLFAVVDRS